MCVQGLNSYNLRSCALNFLTPRSTKFNCTTANCHNQQTHKVSELHVHHRPLLSWSSSSSRVQILLLNDPLWRPTVHSQKKTCIKKQRLENEQSQSVNPRETLMLRAERRMVCNFMFFSPTLRSHRNALGNKLCWTPTMCLNLSVLHHKEQTEMRPLNRNSTSTKAKGEDAEEINAMSCDGSGGKKIKT